MAERGRKIAMLGLALALAVWSGWRILTLGWADALSSRDPAAALSWRSQHPAALLEKGERELRNNRPVAELTAAAREAVTASPLDGRGYFLLASSLASDPERAEAWYELAAKRGPRDLNTRVWLANHALQRGDYAVALRHIDRILRVEPELFDMLWPVLQGAALAPAAQPALLSRLRLRPPWREGLLARLSQLPGASGNLFPLFDGLRHGSGALNESERRPWLDRMAADGEWGPAFLTWLDALAPSQRALAGNLYDGDFDEEPSQAGFGWRFDRVPGAFVSRVPLAQGGHALQVTFLDRRVQFAHVRQMLALSPGHYRLEGRVRLDDLRSERGLVWTLSCARNGVAIGETPPFRGRQPWSSFSLEFEVPSESCHGQWLALRIPARIPAERLIGGTAWFDALSIVRQSGSSGGPRTDAAPD